MKKIRLGVVGLGHRGRMMFELAGTKFDCVIPAAACDLFPRNWHEKQWLMDKPMNEIFPDAVFYESYDEMLKKAGLDAVLVETGADVHADFCVKALEKNIHVLTDIPVVANLKEAERLWQASQKSSAMISVGANPNEQKFAVLLQEFLYAEIALRNIRFVRLNPIYCANVRRIIFTGKQFFTVICE